MPAPADTLTTFTFTTVPRNIISSNGAIQWLELSTFVTVRLMRAPDSNSTADLTLSDFPDLVQWPSVAELTRFRIEFLGRNNCRKSFLTGGPPEPSTTPARHI